MMINYRRWIWIVYLLDSKLRSARNSLLFSFFEINYNPFYSHCWVSFMSCPLTNYGKLENGSIVFIGKVVFLLLVHSFWPWHLQDSSLQWSLELYYLFISLPGMVILFSATFQICSMGHDIAPSKFKTHWKHS